jgi:hypothetical protein
LQDADSERSKQIKEQTVKELLRLVPDGSATEKRLDLFTVSELGIFLDHLRRRKGQLLDGLKQFDISEFERLVNDWAATNITLRTESATLAEFEEDKKASRRQYYPGQE